MDKAKSNFQLIDDFCSQLAKKGQRAGTVGNYRSDIRKFSEWLSVEHGSTRSLLDIGNAELEIYRRSLERGVSPATVNRSVAAMNKFFSWAMQNGGMKTAPSKLKTLRIQEKRGGSALGQRDIAEILKVVGANGTVQEQLIIRLLVETNLQLSEICEVRWVDLEISPTTAVLSVQNAIPHRWRMITLGRVCKRLFWELGYEANADSLKQVFLVEGVAIDPTWIQFIVRLIAKTAGVRVTPLLLRRSLQMDPERDHQELLENGREAVRSQVVDERGRPIPSKKLQENSKSGTSLEGPLYDTFQDIYVIDSLIYDHVILKSLVKVSSGIVRDLRIRKTVLHRSKGRCERCGFIAGETGLLEVHHIIPAAAKEDRYDNCVALCSNCHRLAHLEPRCKEFEKELLTIVRGLVSSVEGARKTPVK